MQFSGYTKKKVIVLSPLDDSTRVIKAKLCDLNRNSKTAVCRFEGNDFLDINLVKLDHVLQFDPEPTKWDEDFINRFLSLDLEFYELDIDQCDFELPKMFSKYNMTAKILAMCLGLRLNYDEPFRGPLVAVPFVDEENNTEKKYLKDAFTLAQMMDEMLDFINSFDLVVSSPVNTQKRFITFFKNSDLIKKCYSCDIEEYLE